MPDTGELSFGGRLALLPERGRSDREQPRCQRPRGRASLHPDAAIGDFSPKAVRGPDRSPVPRRVSRSGE